MWIFSNQTIFACIACLLFNLYMESTYLRMIQGVYVKVQPGYNVIIHIWCQGNAKNLSFFFQCQPHPIFAFGLFLPFSSSTVQKWGTKYITSWGCCRAGWMDGGHFTFYLIEMLTSLRLLVKLNIV
jgi:hypothetical protein